MASITLNNASVQFQIRHHRQVGIKEWLVRRFFLPGANPVLTIDALKSLSLEIQPGQRMGIIGANGAGKSTFLKLLAGVYPPTTGTCDVQGKIGSLCDIHLGFQMDASGWENINFRGFLQGETPKSMARKRQEIAEFSELGPRLEMPVRYFSSGMLTRLAFSIATAIEPDILLIDEVLAAGDLAFQEKARDRLDDLIGRSQLMVMVSHDLETLANYCDRVVWLDQGSIRQMGPTDDVIDAYKNDQTGTVVDGESAHSVSGNEVDESSNNTPPSLMASCDQSASRAA